MDFEEMINIYEDNGVKIKKINENDRRLSPKSIELLNRAKDTLDLEISLLKISFPNFTYILSELKRIPVKNHIKLATDGLNLYYNPYYVCEVAKNSSLSSLGIYTLKKELLHIIIHGILGHYEMKNNFSNKELSWRLMDYCVDNIISRLFEPNVYENCYEKEFVRTKGGDNGDVEFPYGTYTWANSDVRRKRKICKMFEHFISDDHNYWYLHDDKAYMENKSDNDKNSDKKKNPKANIKKLNKTQLKELKRLIEHSKKMKKFWENARIYVFGQAKLSDLDQSAYQLLCGLNEAGAYGFETGDEEKYFEISTEKGIDYTDILTELINNKETVYEDPNSIDVMMYQYGLELYGDIPLIEPLEENEVYSFNNIVIAIDTSGSCYGKIASQFLNETLHLLENIESIGKFDNVILLECDTQICRKTIFHSASEFTENKDKGFALHGFGGTDFNPVFDWISERKGLGDKIDALIYLTDGCGNYPEKKQDVKTYFVMPADDYDEFLDHNNYIEIPEWIVPVRLNVEHDNMFSGFDAGALPFM